MVSLSLTSKHFNILLLKVSIFGSASCFRLMFVKCNWIFGDGLYIYSIYNILLIVSDFQYEKKYFQLSALPLFTLLRGPWYENLMSNNFRRTAVLKKM